MNEPEPAEEKTSTTQPLKRKPTVLWAMLAVVVWCSVIAAGPIVYGQKLAVIKTLIILACMTLFLGVWSAALWMRRGRLLREEKRDNG